MKERPAGRRGVPPVIWVLLVLVMSPCLGCMGLGVSSLFLPEEEGTGRGLAVHASDQRGVDEYGEPLWRCYQCSGTGKNDMPWIDHRESCGWCFGTGALPNAGIGKVTVVPDYVRSGYRRQ